MTGTQQHSKATAKQRFLIVNADDFGRSEAVNLGVAEGFRRGIVTSASLVAAGPAFEQAVEIAKGLPELGVGIHLIANEYTPILPPAQIPRLVDATGRFYSRPHQFARMATNPGLRRNLLQEWDAQIAKIVAAGITLTHIDGHGHCHAHPAAADIVLKLARKYRISHVRLPAEPIWWKPGLNASPRFVEKTVLNIATQVSRQVWKGSLNFPDAFYGFSQGGRMSADIVHDVGRSAPPGVSELMVHVGVSNDEAPGFWTGYDYAGDLQAVTTHSKQQYEAEFGVSLVTHVDGGPDGRR
jgi:chitin disaccharide deacetylase